MAWVNGSFKEDEQDNSKGWVSVDWDEAGTVVFTYRQHIDTTNNGIKTQFKTNANAAKNTFLAKQAKEANIGNIITTFMNA